MRRWCKQPRQRQRRAVTMLAVPRSRRRVRLFRCPEEAWSLPRVSFSFEVAVCLLLTYRRTARPVASVIRRQASQSEMRPEMGSPAMQHRPISPPQPPFMGPRSSYSGPPHAAAPGGRSFPPSSGGASPHQLPYHLAHRPSVDDWQRSRRPGGRESVPYHAPPPPVPQHSPMPPLSAAAAAEDSRRRSIPTPPLPPTPAVVQSWPLVEPPPHVAPAPQRKPFHPDFSLVSPPPLAAGDERRGSYFGDQGRSLPPLRLAISGRASFFDP